MSEGDVEFIGEWKKPEQEHTRHTTDCLFMEKTVELTHAQKLRNVRIKSREPPRATGALEKDPLAPDPITFKCNICVWTCGDQRDVLRHMKAHRRAERPLARAYECDACGKKYARKRRLLYHWERLHGGKRHRCAHCSKFFASERFLEKHVREHSTSYVCAYCKRIFKRRVYLNRHVRNLHEGQASSCDVCDKTFSCAAYARRHTVRIHKVSV